MTNLFSNNSKIYAILYQCSNKFICELYYPKIRAIYIILQTFLVLGFTRFSRQIP